jgi:adenine C2-methylase RlmN of 23S rRNA A2503 and tRNA A37
VDHFIRVTHRTRFWAAIRAIAADPAQVAEVALHVNLIPYNPTGMYEGSTSKALAAFKAVLDRARLPATVRLTRGRDIPAACGQLAAVSGRA